MTDDGVDWTGHPAGPDPDVASETVREAFALLGHDVRLGILVALLEDWAAVYTEPKSYAELMAAVDLQDSGKFNYHLDRLRGTYVRKVDDGYVPTAATTALYRAVVATRPTESAEVDAARVDASCPQCGTAAVLDYERGFLTIDCPDCDDWHGITYPFPQNGLEGREPDEILRSLLDRVRLDVGLARSGQCPDCAGPTTVDLRIDRLSGDGETDDASADHHWVQIACTTCSFHVGVDPLHAVATQQAVAAAFHRIGVDVDELDLDPPPIRHAVESHDPPTLALTVSGPDGDARIVVDEALDVLSVESPPGDGP